MRIIRVMIVVTLLLLPGIAAAQSSDVVVTPAPAPAPAVDVRIPFWYELAQERTPMPAPRGGRTEVFVTRGPGGPEMHMGPDLGAWWKNSEIVKEVGISEQQVKLIEQKFLEHRLKLIDLRADVERQELKFQPLMEEDQPDEAKVGAQLDLLLAARGRLEKANTLMMLGIRKVLTVEQWKKLEEIKESRMRSFRWEREPGEGGVMHFRTPTPEPTPRTRRPPPDTL